MKAIQIRGHDTVSRILVGEALASLPSHVSSGQTVIITDTDVCRHYRKEFPPSWNVLEIPSGETAKTLETVKDICLRLMEMGADRSSYIVGIGGGVVSDIAGFVASIYMRGIPFGFVSTSLLAQVDAGIGGKNGVNLDGYKNMIGCFNQPQFVICDLRLLNTLPKKELRSGFAEVVKYAVIADPALFSYLESNYEKGLSLDPQVTERLVCDSVAIKASIVDRDEKEAGERRLLNFGHTFGHAIEKAKGVSHGEAVSMGMAIAARLSSRMGYLAIEDVYRIESLLMKLGLPIRSDCASEAIVDAMRKDKKRNGNSIHVVLLRGIGHAFVNEAPILELGDAMGGWSLPVAK